MTHTYAASVSWSLEGGDFARGRYSRAHNWSFDGGLSVPASASPQVVPRVWCREDAVDPEEALVAALSSCHMLSFLHAARRSGYAVASYADDARGEMSPNSDGVFWVSKVTLRPTIAFGGSPPDADAHERLHQEAHHTCFIAQSVKTQVFWVLG